MRPNKKNKGTKETTVLSARIDKNLSAQFKEYLKTLNKSISDFIEELIKKTINK